MEAAAKTAQVEVRSKVKATAKREPPKPETVAPTDPAKPAQPVKDEPSRTASLFDAPAPPMTNVVTDLDEDEEVLAGDCDSDERLEGEFDEAA
jgi:hypothetical protein